MLSFRLSLKEIPQHLPFGGKAAKSSTMTFSSLKHLLHPHHTSFFSRKGFSHRASGLQWSFLEGGSGRTIEPLMCSDITFGHSPTMQPKASQAKDLHGGPSLAAAESNTMFQGGHAGKRGGGAPAQQQGPATVGTTKSGQGGSCNHHADNNFPCLDIRPQPSCSTGQELKTGFEQSEIQQSQLTLGKPICPDCSTATDLRAGHVLRPELRDREFASQPNG